MASQSLGVGPLKYEHMLTTTPVSSSCHNRVVAFYWEQEFLILIVAAILLARVYPPLGADYLRPDITATWIAVVLIFVLAGLGLKTEEFAKAFRNVRFNATIQVFSFFVVSSLVFVVSRGLVMLHWLSQDLADGMVVCGSLPMAINTVIVVTKAGDGDEAAAIFNAAAANLVGVLVSPMLILGYLGVSGSMDMVSVFYKLALRVLLPVMVGQVLRGISMVHRWVQQYHGSFKQTQQYCLVFIVYTVFCQTFEKGSNSSISDVLRMILFQFFLLSTVMVLAWYTLKGCFPKEPKLRVMGFVGCTFKTVAVGVPLINAIYADNPAVGLYTLPLLIWHPTQLILGTLLAPSLAAFVKREQERLRLESSVMPMEELVDETTALVGADMSSRE